MSCVFIYSEYSRGAVHGLVLLTCGFYFFQLWCAGSHCNNVPALSGTELPRALHTTQWTCEPDHSVPCQIWPHCLVFVHSRYPYLLSHQASSAVHVVNVPKRKEHKRKRQISALFFHHGCIPTSLLLHQPNVQDLETRKPEKRVCWIARSRL